MPIRLSGINSGLDTDAIVKELAKAYGLKTEKYEKAKSLDFKGTFEEFMMLPEIREEHGRFSRLHEVHAEINIIAQAAYKGLATKEGSLYVTHSPCNDCCKAILTAGIKEIVFLNLYDRETEGLDILSKSGIFIRQLELDDKDQIISNKLF